ncbi:TlpA family protein disulfide reductase [Avibacterium sp. 21-586]|uniref:TlpA family protein disulfide reductase n=1 Tax=Avibacterium sp. 21-586 TaxID=2911534 RepID=UPI002246963C|nr:TlpA disulfide reductase family protein [Avibacterium sp. 21-586]MCW9709540.1 TlpA family protein disulfide reductase [Avibacterium sp. 21-586]
MKYSHLYKKIHLIGLLGTIIFLITSCKDQVANIGNQAPELAAFDLKGQKVELSQFAGKKLLLNFWSETCGICIVELKQFQQLAEIYPDNLQILAINTDGERGNTRKTVIKNELTLPIVKDQLNITSERYQLIGTPTSFLLDPTGKILYKFEGLIPEDNLLALFKEP